MAINIFQSGPSKGKVNSASASTRAKQAKEALAAPAETSSSGTTAVKSQGTLSKVGNFIGKAADTVSKFLPGIGGTIAKGVASIFNDPEWWQSVPGDPVTVNSPLRLLEQQDNEYVFRAPIVEFSSRTTADVGGSIVSVILPTEQMVTQYLLPHVRKVVNAIPLQKAESYMAVLQVNATVYALWHQLKRTDYMLKHGQTYLANMNDAAFPLFQVENSAFLQSSINRLEEYLRANVRLPHTLCEYLAWRFGRVYKSTNTAKAGLVLYSVVDITATIADITEKINALLSALSSSAELQQANADMYNAYYDHDLTVEIRDDTQFSYDMKEFMLRTNCDVRADIDAADNPNPVFIDSSLDNPTTFMASTVSTIGVALDGKTPSVLFPITAMQFYAPYVDMYIVKDTAGNYGSAVMQKCNGSELWGYGGFSAAEEIQSIQDAMNALLWMKTLDVYNKNVMVPWNPNTEGPATKTVDFSSLSVDMGLVPDSIIGNEHVYAFANLVDIERKTSMSYARAEKLVAKDTANLIETLDVATAATPTKTATAKA